MCQKYSLLREVARMQHRPLLSTWRLIGASEAAILPTACPAGKNVVSILPRRVLEVVWCTELVHGVVVRGAELH